MSESKGQKQPDKRPNFTDSPSERQTFTALCESVFTQNFQYRKVDIIDSKKVAEKGDGFWEQVLKSYELISGAEGWNLEQLTPKELFVLARAYEKTIQQAQNPALYQKNIYACYQKLVHKPIDPKHLLAFESDMLRQASKFNLGPAYIPLGFVQNADLTAQAVACPKEDKMAATAYYQLLAQRKRALVQAGVSDADLTDRQKSALSSSSVLDKLEKELASPEDGLMPNSPPEGKREGQSSLQEDKGKSQLRNEGLQEEALEESVAKTEEIEKLEEKRKSKFSWYGLFSAGALVAETGLATATYGIPGFFPGINAMGEEGLLKLSIGLNALIAVGAVWAAVTAAYVGCSIYATCHPSWKNQGDEYVPTLSPRSLRIDDE